MKCPSIYLRSTHSLISISSFSPSQKLCSFNYLFSFKHKFHVFSGYWISIYIQTFYTLTKQQQKNSLYLMSPSSYCSISLLEFWQNFSKDLFMFVYCLHWSLRALITTIPLKLLYSRIMTISMLINSMVIWPIFNPNFTQLLSSIWLRHSFLLETFSSLQF